jgi:hypothetical protein
MGIVRQSACEPTTQPTTHNPQPTTYNPQPTTHNSQHQDEPPPPYPSAASPSLSMGRAVAPPNLGATAPHGSLSKRPVAGLRSPRLVLLLGAPKHDPSKIRERDRVLALGGRRSDIKRDNQPKVGVSTEGIIIEETQLQRNVWGGRRIIVWGWQIEQQKIKK